MATEHVPVTAETVTDEQIGKLWGELTAHEGVGNHPDVLACINALRLPDDVTEQAAASGRARCAGLINARAGETMTADPETTRHLSAMNAA